MTVQDLCAALLKWHADEEVRVQIDGQDGVIEAVEYYADHGQGFVVIRATAVQDQ